MKLLAVVGLISSTVVLAGDPVVLRGVARSQQASYLALQAKGKFECRHQTKRQIPFSQVNDDFCDCDDGSDEPGTPACSQGRFYCRNGGHVGVYLPSSRVEDGICDCCDGSDEATGVCPNTCEALSAEARANRAAQLKSLELGAAKKKAYVEQANKAAEERERELRGLQGEVEGRRDALGVAKERKGSEEQGEKRQQEEKVAEKVKALRESLRIDALSSDLKALKDVYDKIKDRGGKVVTRVLDEMREVLAPVLEEERLAAEAAKAQAGEDPAPSDEGGEDKRDDTEPAHRDEAGADEQRFDESEYEEGEGEYDDEGAETAEEGYPAIPPSHDARDDEGGEEGQNDDASTLPEEIQRALRDAEDGVHVRTDAADAARKEVRDIESALRDLEAKMKDLEDAGAQDYGPRGELYPLKGQCYSGEVNQYTYEMCPYDAARQKEGGSLVATLGRWERLETTPGGGFTFFFTNGQRCWNGPERSLTVTATCGMEEEVLSVDEPSMCEYVMEFRTPAACDVTYAEQLKLDLSDEEDEEGAPGRGEL